VGVVAVARVELPGGLVVGEHLQRDPIDAGVEQAALGGVEQVAADAGAAVARPHVDVLDHAAVDVLPVAAGLGGELDEPREIAVGGAGDQHPLGDDRPGEPLADRLAVGRRQQVGAVCALVAREIHPQLRDPVGVVHRRRLDLHSLPPRVAEG